MPLPGLSAANLARFQAGLQAFQAPKDPPGGLGPVFTENACMKCHNAGAPGGAGGRLVTRIGRIVNGQYDPMIEFGGPLIQDKGIGRFNGVNFVGEVVPPQATIVARRRTTALFGLGLHDMGPLGDGIVQNQAGPTEMRTAPLWGLRFEPSYLHDGRAATIDAAIHAHDGQGLASRNQYNALTPAQHAQLLAFLNSL